MTAIESNTNSVDEFAERVFTSILGTLEVLSMYIGDKLGLYAAMGEARTTRDELAAATGVHPRYVGEWLEQQTVNGIILTDDAAAPPDVRRYWLPPGHAQALLDTDSLAYMAAFIRLVSAAGLQLPGLLDAYLTGGGVSWEQFGDDMRTGQAEMNRPFFMNLVGTEWFPSVPKLHSALQSGARVADIGCGEGWSAIAIAKAYPLATVDGFDIDGPSIAQARRNAETEGVADRVQFHHGDAAAIEPGDPYDVVVGFEFVHDLPSPVDVLSTMRSIAKPDGWVVVMDEKVGETFTGEIDDVERLMYGFSIFVCLPDSMSHTGSVATGTVMRPSTMDSYAKQAGFTGAETLPIEADLWRFYRLAL
jgi:SAM-dependent methyltransferase